MTKTKQVQSETKRASGRVGASVSPTDSAYDLEHELAAGDPALRRTRGVYLTPRPVASYLVRSVDFLLRAEFDLPDGLTGDGVRIVDPACGSGIFLREVLEVCGPTRRTPSLVGFDVLPEACTAAGSVLAACGGGSAAQIVELDPLVASGAEMMRFFHLATPTSHQSTSLPTTLVVLGNPPWSNFGRQNRGTWILDKLADYKLGLDERKHNLGDDFIKFIRWGQFWIDQVGSGILAFVTSNTWLNGLTHRAMRRSLLDSFDELYLYNLHGSAAKRDRTAGGGRDENVFGVKSGVTLCLLVKRPASKRPLDACRSPTVHYAELRGTREAKFAVLGQSNVSSTDWTRLSPAAPLHFFVHDRGGAVSEYESFPRLDEIFGEFISGVQTKNDALFTDFSREVLAARMRERLCGSELPFDEERLRLYMMAPFDMRWVYYEPRLLGRARRSVMRHMLRPNVGLVFMRQSTTPGEYDHFLVTRSLVSDRVFHSAHGAPYLASLYLYEDAARTCNLRPEFVSRLSREWELQFVTDGVGNLATTFGPEDVLHYLYAVVQRTEYRRKYDAALRIDFPRVPICSDLPTLRELCRLGRELCQLHLGIQAVEFAPSAEALQPGLHKRAACGDDQDSPNVPAFRLGGYDVIHRWQKQRRGRRLALQETDYVQSLKNIALETTRLRGEIDVIPF